MYAQVRLCREKSSTTVYAMKKLKKSEMLRRGQVIHVYTFKLSVWSNFYLKYRLLEAWNIEEAVKL